MNANGIMSKIDSFKKIVEDLEPSVIFIEETKVRKIGMLKLDQFQFFELIRINKNVKGGGLAIGVRNELRPALFNEGDDEVESMTVAIHLNTFQINCCVAYGPQENEKRKRKYKFWNHLDAEAKAADELGAGFCLEFDGNLWAGKDIVPGDPRAQNENGRYFEEFLEKNKQLTVVNSLSLCEGLITRLRKCGFRIERSVLDFFVICHRLLQYVNRMVIDEKKEHILTNFNKIRKGGKVKETDHFSLILEMNLKFDTVKEERVEMFNFKNEQSMNLFKEETNNNKELIEAFKSDEQFLEQTQNWKQALDKCLRNFFQKIRHRKRGIKQSHVLILMEERKKILKKLEKEDTVDDQEKLETIEKDISDMIGEKNRQKILKYFAQISQDPDSINMEGMWKLVRKICPKNDAPLPLGKKNHKGQIITHPYGLKKLYAMEYKLRMRKRPIHPRMLM